MGSIVDGKKIWKWSSLILAGGLSIAAGITFFVGAAAAGPLGWAVLAVTGLGIIGPFFFKSSDKKESEARKTLENNLRNNIRNLCDSLQKQLENNLDTLISVRIEGLMQEMDKINSVVFRLADTQRELTWGLNEHLLELYKQIITEALKLIGTDDLKKYIKSVARVPGNSSLFMIDDGFVFPQKRRDELYELISEKIYFVYETENKKILISRILGKNIDRGAINIEDKIGVAHIPLENFTPNLRIRVQLAQQVSKVQIIKQ